MSKKNSADPVSNEEVNESLESSESTESTESTETTEPISDAVVESEESNAAENAAEALDDTIIARAKEIGLSDDEVQRLGGSALQVILMHTDRRDREWGQIFSNHQAQVQAELLRMREEENKQEKGDKKPLIDFSDLEDDVAPEVLEGFKRQTEFLENKIAELERGSRNSMINPQHPQPPQPPQRPEQQPQIDLNSIVDQGLAGMSDSMKEFFDANKPTSRLHQGSEQLQKRERLLSFADGIVASKRARGESITIEEAFRRAANAEFPEQYELQVKKNIRTNLANQSKQHTNKGVGTADREMSAQDQRKAAEEVVRQGLASMGRDPEPYIGASNPR